MSFPKNPSNNPTPTFDSSRAPGQRRVRAIDYGLGVNTVNTFDVKRIDSDYFTEA